VFAEEKMDEISAILEHCPLKSLTPCTGDQGFKIITTDCHKTSETETTQEKRTVRTATI
jgi:hypothetical protein